MSTRRRSPNSGSGALATEQQSATAHRVLLVADESGIDEVCALLEALPRKTRGRAFLEVASADDIRTVDAPSTMSVCWLTRDSRPGHADGEVLDRAVRAWISEMVVTVEHAQNLSTWIVGEAASLPGLRRLIASEQVG
ncbi:siderophore-interacting protein [Glaciihabitans sp. dw_435]|uniref:siderophore-interacting protein n=1 Tax=Glaciihabitans sp. dw_435 TaxID=2720081 RepID=UPI001BD5D286|nr:SIP domain-containing protein [Glaciihabitans sp. dw_435]